MPIALKYFAVYFNPLETLKITVPGRLNLVKISDFRDRNAGRLVKISGAHNLAHAFVPADLPPKWKFPTHLWPLLVDARTQLGTLEGTGKHMAHPELIMRPLQYREAQKSSSLEGTYTDPRKQMLFELEPTEPVSADDPVNARREVSNYARALKIGRSDELPLSLRLIKNLHEVLMDGVRGSDRNPGNFRRLQNQIGRPARYVPPPVTELDRLLHNFELYLHKDDDTDPLVKAFIAHYQFEAIHPFMDGNGRVGRLLLALTIAEWCELSNQWLYMSEFFDRNRDAYIDALYAVSAGGDWEAWIEFCLTGVVEQAKDTMVRYDRLINLRRDFQQRIHESGGTVRLARLVDELFLIPMIRVTDARDLLGVTYPTARSDLETLEGLEIVSEILGAKQKAFLSIPVFDVAYT